jgi:hypothetical protein
MKGVISASVSAGSSQRVAIVTWTAQVMVPAGSAQAGAAENITSRASGRMLRQERVIAVSFR